MNDNGATTDVTRKKIFDKVLEEIDKFISHYQENQNAFDFIYEADIQCDLYASIKSTLIKEGLRAAEEWVVCRRHETKSPSVQLVHAEQKMKRSKIDIAIWDPEDGDNPTKHYDKKKCFFLIEIKQNCKLEGLIERVEGDLKKIGRFKLKPPQTALALGFCTDRKEAINKDIINNNGWVFTEELKSNTELGDTVAVLIGTDWLACKKA